jgi:hypothetical protein
MDDQLKAEYEKALKELKDLYDTSIDIDERKMRLAARKELSKMLKLYEAEHDQCNENEIIESEIINEIREHLEPLGLAKEGTSVVELARLAALKITQI